MVEKRENVGNPAFLVWLFFEERGIAVALVSLLLCERLHFVISLLLLKIFTRNSAYVFIIQRASHTI